MIDLNETDRRPDGGPRMTKASARLAIPVVDWTLRTIACLSLGRKKA